MCNVLLAAGIGDALGVFAETKKSDDDLLLNWDGESYVGSEHHNLKPGCYSDDTQLSIEVAESLIKNSGFNPDDLSQRYVDWIVSGRARGYGRSTKMAIENLQNGKHWSESGVAGSFGNGTAMRCSPLGIHFRNDIQELIKAVKIDSAITHASEEAEAGALAIALAAFYSVNHDTNDLINKILPHLPESRVKKILSGLDGMVSSTTITLQQAANILGSKADVRQTVPLVLYFYLKMPNNYKLAIQTIIRVGGDTDTQGSILSALYGARDGKKDIPQHWIDGIEDKDRLIMLDNQLYNRNKLNYFSQ